MLIIQLIVKFEVKCRRISKNSLHIYTLFWNYFNELLERMPRICSAIMKACSGFFDQQKI